MATIVNSRDPICLNMGTADCFAKENGRCSKLNDTSFRHRKDNRCPFYKPREKFLIELDKLKVRAEVKEKEKRKNAIA